MAMVGVPESSFDFWAAKVSSLVSSLRFSTLDELTRKFAPEFSSSRKVTKSVVSINRKLLWELRSVTRMRKLLEEKEKRKQEEEKKLFDESSRAFSLLVLSSTVLC